MSLSPLVSFKSRFVTYLLNFPRIFVIYFISQVTDSTNLIKHRHQWSPRGARVINEKT